MTPAILGPGVMEYYAGMTPEERTRIRRESKEVRCCAINGKSGRNEDGRRCGQMAKDTGLPSICGGHRVVIKRRLVKMHDGSEWNWTQFRMHVESLRGGGSG